MSRSLQDTQLTNMSRKGEPLPDNPTNVENVGKLHNRIVGSVLHSAWDTPCASISINMH